MYIIVVQVLHEINEVPNWIYIVYLFIYIFVLLFVKLCWLVFHRCDFEVNE
jgi:hypothetical protein